MSWQTSIILLAIALTIAYLKISKWNKSTLITKISFVIIAIIIAFLAYISLWPQVSLWLNTAIPITILSVLSSLILTIFIIMLIYIELKRNNKYLITKNNFSFTPLEILCIVLISIALVNIFNTCLILTVSCDIRICTPEYINDKTWQEEVTPPPVNPNVTPTQLEQQKNARLTLFYNITLDTSKPGARYLPLAQYHIHEPNMDALVVPHFADDF